MMLSERSFLHSSAVLVTLLVALIGASQGQSSRRSPIRSIPVGADVKRDTQFECPEEFGYYPHPADCSQYYVCVFGGALLESCTGGLMYSHELQTCDWPRNVGCGSGSAPSAPSAPSGPSGPSAVEDTPAPPPRQRAPPPPPPPRASPNPVVTSRGQPTHTSHHELIKQQLYAEADEQLPPAEEIENDRQQRVLRGQPSSVGQVQRDRDGYGPVQATARAANNNAIQGQGKVGVFSFGTQVDQQRASQREAQNYRVEPTVSASPSYSKATRQQQAGRALYNGSQLYDPQQYDPYYALYEDDVELYKDADYAQQYNSAQRPSGQQVYRGTPSPRPATPTSPSSPSSAYTSSQQQAYSPLPPSGDDYDDALISSQVNDQNEYNQPIRQSTTRSTTGESFRGNLILPTEIPAPTVPETPVPETSVPNIPKASVPSTSVPILFPSRFRAADETPQKRRTNYPRGAITYSRVQIPTTSENPAKETEPQVVHIVPKIPKPPKIDYTQNGYEIPVAIQFDATPEVHIDEKFRVNLQMSRVIEDKIPEKKSEAVSIPIPAPPQLPPLPRILNDKHINTDTVDNVTKTNTSRFLSLTTGFSFKKDDENTSDEDDSYTLKVYETPSKIAFDSDLDTVADKTVEIDREKKTLPQRVSFKIEELPIVDEKNAYNVDEELDEQAVTSTEKPYSPIPLIIENLPQPGQRPIVIQLKSHTGPRTHGPRIGSDEIIPIYFRQNRVFDSPAERNDFVESPKQTEKPLVFTTTEKMPETTTFTNEDTDTLKVLPKVYLKQVIKRPAVKVDEVTEKNEEMVTDSEESDSILSFLRMKPRTPVPAESRTKISVTLDDNKRHNNIETLPNSRRKGFREPKPDSTPTIQPVVSPFKSLETLRRDVVDKSSVKNQTSNLYGFGPSTTTAPRSNNIVRNNLGSYNPFETNQSIDKEYTAKFVSRNKQGRVTTTTEYPKIKTRKTTPYTTQSAVLSTRASYARSTEAPITTTTVRSTTFKSRRIPIEQKFSPAISERTLRIEPSVSSTHRSRDTISRGSSSFVSTEQRSFHSEALSSLSEEDIPNIRRNDYDFDIDVPSGYRSFDLDRDLIKPRNYASTTMKIVETTTEVPATEQTPWKPVESKRERFNRLNDPKYASAAFDIPASAIPLYENNYRSNRTKQYQVTTTTTEPPKARLPENSRRLIGFNVETQNNSIEVDSKLRHDATHIRHTTERDETVRQTTLATHMSSDAAHPPARATLANQNIKQTLAARRNGPSSPKCGENNPKCNEIKLPRTSSTRGRGSAHYSTASGGESQPAAGANRGTPPPSRARPTLKPSTSIVSKATEFVDIYRYPPHRPENVYPTPQVDKTAAKCRKDVCLLPDCWCGGKDIPGDLPVESVPQLVLLTFDDSVNDLNKGLYSDLFDKGRVNPNGCPIAATFYVSHEWTDYSQVQNLYSAGHEMASHTVSHSFGEQFSQKKWNREISGQREILAAYGGVKQEDVRGMRAPFLSVGGNKMFKMLHDSNFTYDSSMPVYENRPPSWPYTLDYKLFHDCMIPPCPTKSYPGVWEVPMVMWQDLNGGRCSMGDACSNPPTSEGVYKMLLKNFDRHYSTNRAPFGLFYHAAWFTQAHHKEGFIMFLDAINAMKDVFLVTNWQALQWVRDPTPLSRINSFQPFHCNYQDRPKRCNNPKVCNLWHKSGVRYMRTCQPCPDIYPWTGKTGIRSSRIDNDIED